MGAVRKLENKELYSELGSIILMSTVSTNQGPIVAIETDLGHSATHWLSPDELETITGASFRLVALHGWECYPFLCVNTATSEVGWTVEKPTETDILCVNTATSEVGWTVEKPTETDKV
jgi:hypothetical protein